MLKDVGVGQTGGQRTVNLQPRRPLESVTCFKVITKYMYIHLASLPDQLVLVGLVVRLSTPAICYTGFNALVHPSLKCGEKGHYANMVRLLLFCCRVP